VKLVQTETINIEKDCCVCKKLSAIYITHTYVHIEEKAAKKGDRNNLTRLYREPAIKSQKHKTICTTIEIAFHIAPMYCFKYYDSKVD